MKTSFVVFALAATDADAARKLAKSSLHRRHLHHLRTGKRGQLHVPLDGELGNSECQCIGFDSVQGETKAIISSGEKDMVVPYPVEAGSSCKAWDDEQHPFCKGTEKEGFCKDKWCYVNPKDCKLPVLPKPSLYMPKARFQTLPIYYSYHTCGHKDQYGTATKAATQWGLDGCRCIGFDESPGMTVAMIGDKKVEYPAEIGGTCKAWDSGHHPDCTGANQPDWCDKKWCFVDPCSCTAPVAPKVSKYLGDGTFQGKAVFWSYSTCGEEDTFSAEGDLEASKKKAEKICLPDNKPDSKTFGNQKCPCIGFDAIDGETVATVTHADESTEVSFPADLGGSCDQWDVESHPTCKGENAPSWCQASWCYVDARNCHLPVLPKVSAYQPDARFQRLPLYFSYSTCGSKDTWSTNAPDVGKPGCRCIGIEDMPGQIPVTIEGHEVTYPAEMGGTCKAWDTDLHPRCKGSDKADWCQKKWCYVDPCSCSLDVPPKVATFLGESPTFQGRAVFWSYSTCGETDTFSTPEQQKSSKDVIEKSCAAQNNADRSTATVFSRRADGESKSGAHAASAALASIALYAFWQ